MVILNINFMAYKHDFTLLSKIHNCFFNKESVIYFLFIYFYFLFTDGLLFTSYLTHNVHVPWY